RQLVDLEAGPVDEREHHAPRRPTLVDPVDYVGPRRASTVRRPALEHLVRCAEYDVDLASVGPPSGATRFAEVDRRRPDPFEELLAELVGRGRWHGIAPRPEAFPRLDPL